MAKNLKPLNITLMDGQRTTISLSPFELNVLRVLSEGRCISVRNYVLMAIKKGEIDGMPNRSRAVVDMLLFDLYHTSGFYKEDKQ